MLELTDPTVDLVRTYETYERENKSRKAWPHIFGGPIVNLAIGVISGWPYEEHLVGIQRCLVYEIKHLRKRDYFFRMPVGYTNIGDDIAICKNQFLLADSLILSTIEFNDHLHEHSTGMSQIIRMKLRRGFELACIWACSELLNQNNNDWVVNRDNSKFLKFISNADQRKGGSGNHRDS